MELLLLVDAEVQYLVGAKDRSFERTLMTELLTMVEEAESLYGPRDRSYELLEPRITERSMAQGFTYPFRKIRIYLTKCSENERYIAAYELAHEAGPADSLSKMLSASFAAYALSGPSENPDS